MKIARLNWLLGTALLLGTLLISTGIISYSGGQLTGDEILQKVDDQQDLIYGGDLISIVRFDNRYANGTTSYNVFGSLGKRAIEGQPDKTLIYFKEPEDVAGTIFLSIKPRGEDAKLWLYLPALGMVKELISEEKHQSFAGSTFSRREIGERRLTDDYTAKLLGEDTITIDGQDYPCYVLELTAKPDSDVDFPTAKIWVGQDNWLQLKGEDYNRAGNLERTMEVLKLGEFEGYAVMDQLLATNVLKGDSTTITFLERRRPDQPIPDEVFDPENLPSFDPTTWGF